MNIDSFLIDSNASARDALRHLDKMAMAGPVLFIQDEEKKLVGSLTDGDIRRGLLRNLGIDDSVLLFMRKDFRHFVENHYSKADLQRNKELNIRFVPVIDSKGFLIRLVDTFQVRGNIPACAILMAGGRGERLMPLTELTPKPMLRVGQKPIIEYNIDQLISYGITDITISIRYLGNQISDYFKNGSHKNASIQYLTEDIPLGTIGAVKQIKDIHQDYVLIMNSDLLTDIDFEQFFEAFQAENADMAVATVPYHVNVPYAVMELEEGKIVKNFKEKPKYTYYSNAGIYLLKKELIDMIPHNQKYDATDLMNAVIKAGKKLIADPILTYWLDIGRIEDFYKAQEDIKHLKFL